MMGKWVEVKKKDRPLLRWRPEEGGADAVAFGADYLLAEGDSNPDFGAVVDIAGALLCQLIVPAIESHCVVLLGSGVGLGGEAGETPGQREAHCNRVAGYGVYEIDLPFLPGPEQESGAAPFGCDLDGADKCAEKNKNEKQQRPCNLRPTNSTHKTAGNNLLTHEPIAKLPTLSFPRRFWAGKRSLMFIIQFLTI